MDEQRKRELKEAYRNSRLPMGVLAFRCEPTGESFLLASRNISADTNSVTFKRNSGYHPNRHLLELWERYGEEGFAVEVLETLDYRDESDDPADYKDELDQLRDLCLERDPERLALVEVARRSGWQKTHPTDSDGGGGARGSRSRRATTITLVPAAHTAFR